MFLSINFLSLSFISLSETLFSKSESSFLIFSTACSIVSLLNITSLAGNISALFTFSILLCDSTLKVLIESTSSPNNSILKGLVELGGNTSNIPPLNENSPFPSTVSNLS